MLQFESQDFASSFNSETSYAAVVYMQIYIYMINKVSLLSCKRWKESSLEAMQEKIFIIFI